ncbi:MAG TPA: CoA transferase, partial [Actinomycetota bacterium]|nr:CoA transferase [Actinomycetota bacterium]
ICGKSDYPDDPNPQLRLDARYAMVSAFQDADFEELCKVVGRKDLLENFKSHPQRVKETGQLEIYQALEEWAADKSRSQVVKALTDAGILAQPVMNDKEVYESNHFRERGTLRWLNDPTYGDILIQSGYSVGMMSETPRRTRWIWRPVGADNVKILHDMLGYPMSTIKDWYEQSVL